MITILYILLAILGLSFLIFIHELGHYLMAKREGMKVDVFSIGFGKPLIHWEWGGCRWQVGWLLFGGYVKIKGMDSDGEQDPYSIKDGFFGKSPWARIKVAFMGPLVNLVFALVAFMLLWSIGGREKPFAELTTKIGWVEPDSELYMVGLRPGDEITAYDDHPYRGVKDHFFAVLGSSDTMEVEGFTVDYKSGEKSPFDYKIRMKEPASLEGLKLTVSPAMYLIYDTLSGGQDNPLPEGAPAADSGIQYGDQLVWIDGETLFSLRQLGTILNDSKALLTIRRDGKTHLARVPRVAVEELKLDRAEREELVDWQFAAKLKNTVTRKLSAIPYNLTNDCVVESELEFLDAEAAAEAFPETAFSDIDRALKPGDRIIAVNGIPVKYAYQLLSALQDKQVHLIVKRNNPFNTPLSADESNLEFEHQFDMAAIEKIAGSIGTDHPINQVGDYYLLKPIVPKTRAEFAHSADAQAIYANQLMERKRRIEEIEDSAKKEEAMEAFLKQENQLMLGLPIQDRRVKYNPLPTKTFGDVAVEIQRTLGALLTGSLNPKFLSGPVGIVQVVGERSMLGLSEALFWLGAISLNLGVLNLLPIPMLDGGTILICFVELFSRRKIKPKTLERIILPFAVLLIAFFLFVTFHDLSRLFSRFL